MNIGQKKPGQADRVSNDCCFLLLTELVLNHGSPSKPSAKITVSLSKMVTVADVGAPGVALPGSLLSVTVNPNVAEIFGLEPLRCPV